MSNLGEQVAASLNLVTLSIIGTLVIYHILLFIGRKNKNEEKYILYFSLLGFFSFFYILLRVYYNRSVEMTHYNIILFSPTLQSIVVFGVGVFLYFTISALIKTSKKDNYFIWFVYVFTFFIPISISILYFINEELFTKVSVFNTILMTLGLIITFVYVATLITKYKKWTNKVVLTVFIGASIMILGSSLIGVPTNLGYDYFEKTYLHVGISIFVFAYALAKKVNRENMELILLKDNLEHQVEERTLELKEANNHLEEANREKTDFLINLAHETKTPLTLIQNYFDRHIKKHEISYELKIVKQNLDKLTRDMINSFDVERILQGKIIYDHNKNTDFSELLEQKIILFREMASNKNIKITSDIDNNCYCKADALAIERIIANLIDNAVKYTPENGNIHVNLKQNNDNLIFVVKNDGHGILEEEQKNIFKPYYQLSRSKKNTQGIGMGLNIVNHTIKSLGGTITLDSQPDKHTIFTVKINNYKLGNDDIVECYDIIKPYNNFHLNKKSKVYDENKYNLLIVEDNPDLINYLGSELSNNYNVAMAVNGLDAINKLNSMVVPDLILSDIMMDEMDGNDFFKKIRKDDKYKHVPFIFLTAKASIDDQIEGLSEGAIDYITKPFNMESIDIKINNLIKSNKMFIQKGRNETLKKMKEFINLNDGYFDTSESKKNVFAKNCIKYELTTKEQQFSELLISGLIYKQIADKMFVSENTVAYHVKNIYKKTGVKTKIELKNVLESKEGL